MKKKLSVMMAVIAVACAVSCDKDNGRKVIPVKNITYNYDDLTDGEFETFKGDHIYMGCYQSSILNHSNNDHFFGFVFYNGDLYIRGEYRCLGEALRPVWYGYAD